MVRQHIDLIKSAIQDVEAPYFRLATTYEPNGIVRERVFCYELYHQIRRRMTSPHPLSLNGEIDKRGHIDFKAEDRRNPDFVFHIPGTHSGNTLIVEVKGTLKPTKNIIDDLETLLLFVARYDYQAGVFLLYNHSLDDLIMALDGNLVEVAMRPEAASVYLLAAPQSGNQCQELVLSALRT